MRNFENGSQHAKINNAVPTKVKYKDYHDFLENYNSNNGRKENDQESVSSTDSGIAGSVDQKFYSLTESKSNSTSSSSLNCDLIERAVKIEANKAPATSYRQFLENYNKKKFGPVKPIALDQSKPKMKSEIFIQINEPVKPKQNQNETQRMQNGTKQMQNGHQQYQNGSKQYQNGTKQYQNGTKHYQNGTQQDQEENKTIHNEDEIRQKNRNKIVNEIKANFEKKSTKEPSVLAATTLPSQNVSPVVGSKITIPPPPPPPPQPSAMEINKTIFSAYNNNPTHTNPRGQINRPTTNRTNPQGQIKIEKRSNSFRTTTVVQSENELATIDKNDPNVKKLVYNTYRGLLGAYNNKANDMISTLPRNMVRQDKGIARQLESIKQSERVGVTPPPPPPVAGHIPSVRLKTEIPDRRMEPPPCVQNAMMTKDKKPFTYTPGGIDLSEIRSPRMARRIERNANFPGVQDVPRQSVPQQTGPLPPSALAAMQPQLQVQVFPSGVPPPPTGGAPPPPPPPPMQPLPTQKCVTADNEVVERPDMTRIIPENPMALLRKTSGPPQRRNFTEQDNFSPQAQAQLRSPPSSNQNQMQRRSYVEQESPQVPLRNQSITSPQGQPANRRSFVEQDYHTQPISPPYSVQNNVQPVPRSVEPPFVPRQPTQQEQAPLKTSTVQLGSLYIPPVNNRPNDSSPKSANSVSPASPPNTADSPKPQSPQTPTLNKAPRPWQKQKSQQAELPSWAIRDQPKSPSAEPQVVQNNQNVQVQSPRVTTPVQTRPSPQQVYQQPEFNGRQQFDVQQRPAGPNVVWVTQPQVMQHPGGQPNSQQYPTNQQQVYMQQQQQQQQQQQRKDAQGVRIIPIQIEGASNNAQNRCTTPSTPNGERSFNRQQSWSSNPTQSNAFRVIQKITQTDGEDVDDQPAVEHPPRAPQQFQQTPADQIRKLKLSEGDRELMNKFKQEVDEENYLHNEVDPRYRGAAIPSKAFKLLQSMTDGPESSANTAGARPVVATGGQANRSPQVRTIPVHIEDDGNSRPYVHPSEQTVPEPRKYTGSSIPSRSFKILQAMTAPNNCANAHQVNENRENFPNDPSLCEQRVYEQNYPLPPPPYWHDYYWPYYQQSYPPPPSKEFSRTDEASGKGDVIRDTHSSLSTPMMVAPSPVPMWGYYPPYAPPYNEYNRRSEQCENKDETASNLRATPVNPRDTPFNPRDTPQNFWLYPPYAAPYNDYNKRNEQLENKEKNDDVTTNPRDTPVTPRGTPFNPGDTPQNFWQYPSYTAPYNDYNRKNEQFEGKERTDEASTNPRDTPVNPRDTPFNHRDTPQNFWQYPYPYYYPGGDNQEIESDNLQEYWDPYGYYPYYYYHPQMYSPYPFCYQNYDSEDTAGYSSTDEMAYYTQKYIQEQQNYQNPPQIVVTPTMPENADAIQIDDGNDEETDSSDTEVEGDNEIIRSGSLQKIPSVADMAVYDEDAPQSDEDDGDSNAEEETFPHQLSIIFEESERSDSSMLERRVRESSVSTIYSDSTIVDNDDEDEINATVTVRLPLQLSFTVAENNQEVTTVTVGDSEIDTEPMWANIDNEVAENIIDSADAKEDNCDLNKCDIENKCDKEDKVEICDSDPVVPKCSDIDVCPNQNDEEEEIDFWSTIKSNESPPLHVMKDKGKEDSDGACSASSSDSSSSKSSDPEKDTNQNDDCNYSSFDEEDSDSDESVDSIKITNNAEEKTTSVREMIQAIEENRLINTRKSSAKSSIKSLEDYSEEEIDSGVTSDISRHISEIDTDEFSELKKMTRYQRAATHSRLYKLLQEVCATESDDENETENGHEEGEEIRVSLIIKQNKEKQMLERREQLSLPLKNSSDQESFCSSGINSPGSGEFINEKLVNELIHSLLKRKKGHIFRSMPKEKLYAAAIRILQEEIDCSESCSPLEEANSFLSPLRYSTENSTPAQTPQEFYGNYNEYKNYYETWRDADSKTQKIISNLNKSGARCPRVSSTKSLLKDPTKVLESHKNPPNDPAKIPNVESASETNEATDAS